MTSRYAADGVRYYACAIIAIATLTACVISQEEMHKDFVGNVTVTQFPILTRAVLSQENRVVVFCSLIGRNIKCLFCIFFDMRINMPIIQ